MISLAIGEPLVDTPAAVIEATIQALNRQETLGLAGETGCGKSVTARSILRLIDPPGRIISGNILFEGQNLLALDEAAMRSIRGSKISMIMQDPKFSLNRVMTVGSQIAEAYAKKVFPECGEFTSGGWDPADHDAALRWAGPL